MMVLAQRSREEHVGPPHHSIMREVALGVNAAHRREGCENLTPPIPPPAFVCLPVCVSSYSRCVQVHE